MLYVIKGSVVRFSIYKHIIIYRILNIPMFCITSRSAFVAMATYNRNRRKRKMTSDKLLTIKLQFLSRLLVKYFIPCFEKNVFAAAKCYFYTLYFTFRENNFIFSIWNNPNFFFLSNSFFYNFRFIVLYIHDIVLKIFRFLAMLLSFISFDIND